MYWREKFPTHAHALQAARAFRRGRPLTMSQHQAVVHALGELDETPELGSLKSFLKKAVKTATKLSPSHQIAKAISPKLLKLSPSHALAEKISTMKVSSAPKAAPQVQTPTEPVMLPPTLAPGVTTAPDFSMTLPFAQSSGGGGGGFSPAQASVDQPSMQADAGPNWWLIGGASAAGLLLLWLMLKKRR